MLQAREILSSEFFMCAFHTSVKWCAAATAEALQEHFDSAGGSTGAIASMADRQTGAHGAVHSSPDSIPQEESASMVTAAMLPRLTKVADQMLTTGSALSEEMCRLPAVRALLDATFASGPFLKLAGSAR